MPFQPTLMEQRVCSWSRQTLYSSMRRTTEYQLLRSLEIGTIQSAIISLCSNRESTGMTKHAEALLAVNLPSSKHAESMHEISQHMWGKLTPYSSALSKLRQNSKSESRRLLISLLTSKRTGRGFYSRSVSLSSRQRRHLHAALGPTQGKHRRTSSQFRIPTPPISERESSTTKKSTDSVPYHWRYPTMKSYPYPMTNGMEWTILSHLNPENPSESHPTEQ